MDRASLRVEQSADTSHPAGHVRSYWLAHTKCSHKADPRRNYAKPFTVADAALHETYEEQEGVDRIDISSAVRSLIHLVENYSVYNEIKTCIIFSSTKYYNETAAAVSENELTNTMI